MTKLRNLALTPLLVPGLHCPIFVGPDPRNFHPHELCNPARLHFNVPRDIGDDALAPLAKTLGYDLIEEAADLFCFSGCAGHLTVLDL